MSEVKNSEDIEMASKPKGTSFDTSRMSAHFTKMNDSILDNVVSSFSFVNDHHVRGRWRTFLSISVVLVPLLVFALLLWYQLERACVATSNYYPLISTAALNNGSATYSTESTIRNFLGQDSIHYCSSMVSHVEISDDVDGGVNAVTYWYPCKIQNHPTSNTGPCREYKDLGKVTDGIDNGYCFTNDHIESGGNVAVFYAQCVPIQTALVNSIQTALYSIAATILLYLALRVLAKDGLRGLFSPSRWLEMLNNSNKDWKSLDNIE